jgi:hypothetical protein
MRQRQIGLFLKNSWGELKTPPDRTQHFEQLVRTIVLPYYFVLQVMVVGKATDLKTVTCRHKYGVPSFLQLILDRYKERHMRRIIEIYPDLFIFHERFHERRDRLLENANAINFARRTRGFHLAVDAILLNFLTHPLILGERLQPIKCIGLEQ